jgi:hypothetical protein
MTEQFRLPIRTAVALGYDEEGGQKKDQEDIVADLDYLDFTLEDFLSNLATGGAGVGTTRSASDPAVVQSTSVASTPTFSEYRNQGGFTTWTAIIQIDSAGTGNNAVTVATPVNIAAGALNATIGNGRVNDTGTATYPVRVSAVTATTIQFTRQDTTASSAVGVDPNFALASGDIISFTVSYPSA